jgi:hypothetical protein
VWCAGDYVVGALARQCPHGTPNRRLHRRSRVQGASRNGATDPEIYGELQAVARSQTVRPVFPEGHRRFDSDAYYMDHEITRLRVANVVMASDSIVVYSARDSHEGALAVAAAVGGLIVAGFRSGVALRGALAIGELDELDLEDDAVGGENWTARFGGLVGLGLVRAYELESHCNWAGAIVHPDVIEWLDEITLFEHDDGVFTALDQMCSARVMVETEAPVKRRGSTDKTEIVHERHWAINWPFLAGSVDWFLQAEEVAASSTTFGRSVAGDAEVKREESVAFMRRANEDHEATNKRRAQRRRADPPGLH